MDVYLLTYGFCLQSGLGGKVSCFEKVVTDGPDDIYSSVRPSTGPMLVTRTNDRVEMSGYLHLYSMAYFCHLCAACHRVCACYQHYVCHQVCAC